MNFFQKIKFSHVLLFGFVLRLLFVLVGAQYYFGRTTIHQDNDTMSWMYSFINWWEHGEYTVTLNDAGAYFNRAPVYSFFLGFFYLLSGKDLPHTFLWASWTQLFLDLLVIWMLYKIVLKASGKQAIALLASFLYACYPFVIVWIPVAYSEELSLFLMISGLYFIQNKNQLVLGGIALALGALCRFQVILLVPAILAVTFFSKDDWTYKLKRIIILGTTVVLCYGIWPARNYFLHQRFVLFQDGHTDSYDACYTYDVYAFWNWMNTMQTQIEPQFTQIITNDTAITFPQVAYTCPQDSQLIRKGVYLLKHCSSGISFFQGYWKEPLMHNPNCNAEIVSIFDTLKAHQIKAHPWRVYLVVPLMNLQKCFFKFNLVNRKGLVLWMGRLLFSYRTLLLLLGFLGLLLMKKEALELKQLCRIIFVFLCIWYLILAFIYRDTEIRYFMQNDVLMLIPAAVFLYQLARRFKLIKSEH